MRRILLGLALLGGCSGSGGPPAWAIDSVQLDRVGTAAMGFQTWSLYADGWTRQPGARHYVCSVVITLNGEKSSPTCDACDEGWSVAGSLLESDCPTEYAEDPRWLSLQALARSPLDPALTDAPYPGQTSTGWADYGEGWLEHGWVYPAELDNGSTASEADPDEALMFYPLYAWEL